MRSISDSVNWYSVESHASPLATIAIRSPAIGPSNDAVVSTRFTTRSRLLLLIVLARKA